MEDEMKAFSRRIQGGFIPVTHHTADGRLTRVGETSTTRFLVRTCRMGQRKQSHS